MVEVERAFLSMEEIETMLNKVFVSDRLNQVKDIFLFSCFTFLALDSNKLLTNQLHNNVLSIGNDLETIRLPCSALVFNL